MAQLGWGGIANIGNDPDYSGVVAATPETGGSSLLIMLAAARRVVVLLVLGELARLGVQR